MPFEARNNARIRLSTTSIPGSATEGPPVRIRKKSVTILKHTYHTYTYPTPPIVSDAGAVLIANMGDENLSKDFKEILQKSNLNEKTKDTIKTISKGRFPSGKKIARPDLMNILRFFIASYSCTNDEDKIESIDDSVSVGEEDENDSPLPTGGAKKPDDSPEEGDGNEKKNEFDT